MCIVERRSERSCWDAGISTRYARKLLAGDVKEFVEEVLKIKCGKIHFYVDEGERGIRFYIRGLNFFEKRSSKKNHIIQLEKCVFIAYDFKFYFEGDRLTSDAETQAWIDFMTKKFGKDYERFMFIYNEE